MKMVDKPKRHAHSLPQLATDKIPTAKSDRDRKRLPVPVSPLIHSALRAIYAGGPKSIWESDLYGRPLYKYETKAGRITFFFAPPPDFGSRFHHSIALYYTPRLGFIYSGSLRQAVNSLSVETADVFLILMSRIAELQDPRKGIARISLDEIAQLRGVYVRHGSKQNLYEDFRQEVLRLADMRLTMAWKDYKTGGEVTFGKERPDRLLDILDIEYKRGKEKWTSFRFRCGQALSHFLDHEGLFWIGYYSRALLHLSPYHDALTKKLGTYWILVGTVAGKKGSLPSATPKTILNFCGEEIDQKHPGYTVDAFIEAHQRLEDLGVIESIPVLEPTVRSRGYFEEWLNTALTVKLSEDLWRIADSKERPRLPHGKMKPARKEKYRQISAPLNMPKTADELIAKQTIIRRFRADHYLRQAELARAVGVTRQTLSSYERGLHALPGETAIKILSIWRQKVEA
ncbi:MAG TPA: helix-turn-helix transcriptional regulator [Syntrophales bacterium]|nr:helix-turn-helix transcriptional regulator [Syntrophales bacterium]